MEQECFIAHPSGFFSLIWLQVSLSIKQLHKDLSSNNCLTMSHKISFTIDNMQIFMTTYQWPRVLFTRSWGMAEACFLFYCTWMISLTCPGCAHPHQWRRGHWPAGVSGLQSRCPIHLARGCAVSQMYNSQQFSWLSAPWTMLLVWTSFCCSTFLGVWDHRKSQLSGISLSEWLRMHQDEPDIIEHLAWIHSWFLFLS